MSAYNVDRVRVAIESDTIAAQVSESDEFIVHVAPDAYFLDARSGVRERNPGARA